MAQMEHPELTKSVYRYAEAAAALDCSVATVLRMVESLELERIYLRRREPRITRDSIVDCLRKKRAETSSRFHA